MPRAKAARGTRNLQGSLFSNAYVSRLSAAAQLFVAWLASQSLPAAQLTAAVVDGLLVQYLQSLFDRNLTLSLATHTVLAAQHANPRWKHKLPQAWNSIKSWKLQQTPQLRVPIPPQVLDCIIVSAMLKGFVHDRQKGLEWISFAIILMVGFDAMLRPGELKFSRKDVTLPSEAFMAFTSTAVILIKNPKNRAHFGRMQFANVKSARSLAWLEWLCVGLPKSASLCPITLPKMRSMWKQLMLDLRISDLKFTLSSLRTGGATALFMGGVPIDQLRFAGRWRSVHTLEHYVQESVATTIMSKLSSSQCKRLAAYLNLAPLVQAPPPQPWWSFFSRTAQFSKLKSLKLL